MSAQLCQPREFLQICLPISAIRINETRFGKHILRITRCAKHTPMSRSYWNASNAKETTDNSSASLFYGKKVQIVLTMFARFLEDATLTEVQSGLDVIVVCSRLLDGGREENRRGGGGNWGGSAGDWRGGKETGVILFGCH